MKRLLSNRFIIAIPEEKRRVFVKRLMAWGRKNRRNFPWRRSDNPFHILVAELMLQRTIARQVEPVYTRFITRYPTPQNLAKARLKDIAKDLQSLGLAYRAQRLKQTAGIIVSKFKGKIPATLDELLQLPGVGRYVANALLCFGFGKDVPVVDANVLRVMKRVFSITTSKETHKKPEIWDLMANVIPKQKARQFNLSIIDFASLVCTAKNPLHEACPLRDICDFYREHTKATSQKV